MNKDREAQLAKDLDNYVRLLRDSPEEAASFLEKQWDTELIELCDTWKTARESAIKSGYIIPKTAKPLLPRRH